MDTGETITLLFLRDDGKQEEVHLTHHTVTEARDVVQGILRSGGGLYVKTEIRRAGQLIETIENKVAL